MAQEERNLNPIIDAIVAGFSTRYTERNVSRNWQDRSAYKNSDLERGELTVIYTGEIPNDAYNTYIKLLVIGRIYCGSKAKGLDVERAELEFLQEWRNFCNSSAFGNISILSVSTSQQQEAPDGWFISECRAGPFDLAGEIDWLPVGPSELPEEISVSQSPDVGFGHEDDYFSVGENF
ncbi:TPA: hypothetical protein RQJ78_002431 [Vibrio vulnificus]|uniref:hypothetical protein n=1 Tax=Vibrio vulnificus TaxID=672 RepID=UPI0019D49354|nr:hypothetical protein [Vibrio vulnificus]MBN8145550.1 hypothetical protein [Vibrio vulnificus]HAS6108098.1 hypothetical protein [Vibrio vulnificus]HAS6162340.1 hypothetical protein [Vibrio vulnificus]HAS6325967.1 hypothetical protein [Vibrio vulnificus]HAU8294269.1 hypothetical protein [Vibrio vulnificus]